jgi:hypothetical protein
MLCIYTAPCAHELRAFVPCVPNMAVPVLVRNAADYEYFLAISSGESPSSAACGNAFHASTAVA